MLDNLLKDWLLEDIGRGDRTTSGLLLEDEVIVGTGHWLIKEPGVIAGLPIAARVFELLDQQVNFLPTVAEGEWCEKGTVVAKLDGSLDSLLTGERVALNLGMRLSGIATMTRKYVEKIADLPVQLVDTRKTTPGLRILENMLLKLVGPKIIGWVWMMG
jgi:Nicotinate-nucleotide pyrophosphorylase